MHANDTLKIQDYGIIGDCRAAALIGRNGSLDWLCWPRFDSPAIFASLLDRERGGHWQIAPAGEFGVERRYLPHTNILQTTFHCAGGTGVLTDLMPVASEEFKKTVLTPEHEILRQVECVSGEVEWTHEFRARAAYGLGDVAMSRRGELGWRGEVNDGCLWLRSSLPHPSGREKRGPQDGAPRKPQDGTEARFRLKAGEKAWFSLTYSQEAPAVVPCLDAHAQQRIERSQRWWEQWAARARYQGPYREAVERSALTLKLLAYAPSGAIVAAPTTSLPERIGGDLNWDYRYCWLRDASLTVRALLGVGYREEAEEFLEWMLHATRLTQPELRIVYTIFGQNAPRERELPLRGYAGSRPVRIGNAAREQLQLDVYGEVIDAATQIAFDGVPFDRETQKVLRQCGEYVIAHWDQPDEGIWEPRSGKQHHTHSRLLCWVALDRLCKMAERQQVEKMKTGSLMAAREAIARDIREHAWNEPLQSYTSTLGGDAMDASLLLLAWYGFEAPDSPRMQSTYRSLTRELRAGPELLYRYRPQNPEGAFGICAFWEVEYLATGGGTPERAQAGIEQLLRYANDLGLYAEEIDPTTGEPLGNFPQGFTHIGLINAALSLEARAKGEHHLPHRNGVDQAEAA